MAIGLLPASKQWSGHSIEDLTQPMPKRALTATQVAALSDHTVHWVAPSLYLQIRPQGTRSWLFRYYRDGTNQWMGLGSVADKPLSEARDEAAMLRVLVKRGGDPMAERREVEAAAKPKSKAKQPTFAECAEKYIEAHRSGWKNDKHIAQWESTLRIYAGPVIGKRWWRSTARDHRRDTRPVQGSRVCVCRPSCGTRRRAAASDHVPYH